MKMRYLFAFLFIGLMAAGTAHSQESYDSKLYVKSAAFKYGERIPIEYTCEGENISPQLSWTEGPENTVCYAIIVDDPDAPGGVWSHWVVYNIPAAKLTLSEDFERVESMEIAYGSNDFDKLVYGGPCPPPGEKHRYYFKVYALDKMLEPDTEMDREKLLKAMRGHAIAFGELMGTFSR
ncbi:MAG: YbhB/YbcL family Raf kinase inhibitor-like protein [Bacteroidales bacterium]|nr:YbhB/YbcL family Raf kinase inhibitor-like protein [Bacteroidales bacterium]MCF8351680.1 YbhB/YbcL family Raf kinase inhibitor-like protein [Bacteroidales bacterium]MCF8376241.1 YbhB/YbcL family Raf kinase inhibitor-like protein [Bacteroidales bacterium]MCF8401202.1 YbhB/YbcL family Raf kinase inhibitor-like protein [Bacteroidales bacterium]